MMAIVVCVEIPMNCLTLNPMRPEESMEMQWYPRLMLQVKINDCPHDPVS